jgi:hypothetical protein
MKALLAALALALAAPAALAQSSGGASRIQPREVPPPGTAAPSAPAGTASAPVEGVRPALFPAYAQTQALVRANDYPAARAALAPVLAAVPELSPYERFQAQLLQFTIALGLNEIASAESLLGQISASGRLKPAELLPFRQNLMVTAFKAEDLARAARLARALRSDPLAGAQLQEQASQIELNSLYVGKDWKAAAAWLEADHAARRQAGAADQGPNFGITEQRLRMLASCYSQLKQDADYQRTLEQLAQAYPKRDYWVDLINAVGRDPAFADRWWQDLLRLKASIAGLEQGEDYLSAAEGAHQARLFVEARAWLQQGAGSLAASAAQAQVVAKLKAQNDKAVAEDDAVMGDPAALARISREPVALVHWGMSLIAAGRAEPGIALLEEALKKPTLKQPEETRLRLAAAYAQAGQKDKARALFSAIKDKDGGRQLARLWLLYLAGR